MKKILAFTGSNSSTSINAKLLNYVLNRVSQHEVLQIELSNYNVPIYSEDIEKNNGLPNPSKQLKKLIDDHQALIISVNEHNSAPSAFFKNHIDWLSRVDAKFLQGKKILLMSTSPGNRGAKSSLAFVRDILFPRFGAEVIESFSLPSFGENFDDTSKKLTNEVYALGLDDVVTNFEQNLLN
ncbi:NADPH-dependent FMN reductase [Psychroflexus salis]|uniref:FMN reductase n=1 Tax=Psychroflexus salis TaxID=1526574 RepID=A0A917A0X6_9FLAO|nr:NAD(P)H-dependent oxidoreductase [Psychroflexus salis]GGE20379.1 FMN reductase [Psychroflexus salis]